jgi:Fic family protein
MVKFTPRVRPPNIEEQMKKLRVVLAKADPGTLRLFVERLDLSCIYHDAALEGVVLSQNELMSALDPNVIPMPDSGMQAVYEEIRNHKKAIDIVRELATKRRVQMTLDLLKRLYVTLYPSEGDVDTVKYRKDTPLHRLYFHEITPPDRIAYKLRKFIDWLNTPENRAPSQPLRLASRAHLELVQIYPFSKGSGRLARLLMNFLLIRHEYLPGVIHATERHRYYESLRGPAQTLQNLMLESLDNSIESAIKFFAEQSPPVPLRSVGA